ncbi:MAG: sigma-54-dependent Fis family transcriptional regulator [Deltaproteobacteria bacterium]|nr:sigma-54-dependent Fis family transcriptional regulator [Deltaproteobacteria bacterium]
MADSRGSREADTPSGVSVQASTPFPADPDAISPADLRRSYRRLAKLYELAGQLFSAEALPRLFERIVGAAVELLGAERALLATCEGGKLVPQWAHQVPITPGGEMPLSTTMTGRVLDKGESILTFDAAEEPKFSGSASVVAHGIRSVMCCPLGNPAEPIGLLYADNNVRVRAFDHEDLKFLQALAHYACIAIGNLTRLHSERAVAKARTETLERAYGATHHLVGRSAALRAAFELARRVAAARAPVVILGETGVGKEVVARAIHQESDRRDGPFVPVNMGTLSRETAESQLFGHVKGSFTDAIHDHHGFFEQANGGVLFLDEITTASPEIQVMLLRAIQEQRVRPMGAKREVPVDVRVITATNVNLDREVKEGRFRDDLFYRINVARIEVPPLRERRDDIEPLAHHFLARLAPGKSFEAAALRAMCAYSWPGNVRELMNAIEYATIVVPGDMVRLADLPRTLAREGSDSVPTPSEAPESLKVLIKRTEREHIRRALEFTGGHRDNAIKLLDMSRAKFYEKLREYDLGDYPPKG